MKFKISLIAAAAALSIGGSSCSDYLDKEVDLTLQAENVFSDYDRTRGYQARLYVYLLTLSKDTATPSSAFRKTV